MNTIARIRKDILKMTQAELARACRRPQSTVSRWEAGVLEPASSDLAAIRQEALARGVNWRDEWFWEPAAPQPPVPAE